VLDGDSEYEVLLEEALGTRLVYSTGDLHRAMRTVRRHVGPAAPCLLRARLFARQVTASKDGVPAIIEELTSGGPRTPPAARMA
jgi:hypothetical protein